MSNNYSPSSSSLSSASSSSSSLPSSSSSSVSSSSSSAPPPSVSHRWHRSWSIAQRTPRPIPSDVAQLSSPPYMEVEYSTSHDDASSAIRRQLCVVYHAPIFVSNQEYEDLFDRIVTDEGEQRSSPRTVNDTPLADAVVVLHRARGRPSAGDHAAYAELAPALPASLIGAIQSLATSTIMIGGHTSRIKLVPTSSSRSYDDADDDRQVTVLSTNAGLGESTVLHFILNMRVEQLIDDEWITIMSARDQQRHSSPALLLRLDCTIYSSSSSALYFSPLIQLAQNVRLMTTSIVADGCSSMLDSLEPYIEDGASQRKIAARNTKSTELIALQPDRQHNAKRNEGQKDSSPQVDTDVSITASTSSWYNSFVQPTNRKWYIPFPSSSLSYSPSFSSSIVLGQIMSESQQQLFIKVKLPMKINEEDWMRLKSRMDKVGEKEYSDVSTIDDGINGMINNIHHYAPSTDDDKYMSKSSDEELYQYASLSFARCRELRDLINSMTSTEFILEGHPSRLRLRGIEWQPGVSRQSSAVELFWYHKSPHRIGITVRFKVEQKRADNTHHIWQDPGLLMPSRSGKTKWMSKYKVEFCMDTYYDDSTPYSSSSSSSSSSVSSSSSSVYSSSSSSASSSSSSVDAVLGHLSECHQLWFDQQLYSIIKNDSIFAAADADRRTLRVKTDNGLVFEVNGSMKPKDQIKSSQRFLQSSSSSSSASSYPSSSSATYSTGARPFPRSLPSASSAAAAAASSSSAASPFPSHRVPTEYAKAPERSWRK